ncbi:hypothetical protein [Aeromicrobium sp. Leaf291]|uniref:hypothetical protein n=1 Tax=Aeromicrobium sp. Leaf291 TaxID=1736325 RepID=UPI000700E145|nr:hypothetical protein [Aeromicrobium sp. Leaf291]KQP81576.1 hypothetical protein ASF35_16225 [Aeromicrobium sp. Leaf291]
MTDSLSRLSINETAPGRAEVSLDGTDVSSQLAGIDLRLSAGAVAHAVLHVHPANLIDFDGLARVYVGDPSAPDPGPATAVFLGRISAEELEKAALQRADLGTEPHALTAAMLRQLIEWADVRP